MKKISLQIPTPCHEDWNAMAPDARGRFCGSCQKSVVDFSAMSDRQIAEFFKKPVGSVCGRFHNDQLNREIALPKKRIPWLRYFFTISLPAFLASCKGSGREEVMGIALGVNNVQRTVGDTVLMPPLPMVGNALTMDKPIDSLPKRKAHPLKEVDCKEGYTVGELAPPPIGEAKVEVEAQPLPEVIKEASPMDTVNITAYDPTRVGSTIAGSITVVRTTGKKQSTQLTESPERDLELTAYPNPVRAGERLTVGFMPGDAVVKQLQLFSASGAVVPWQQNLSFQNKKLELQLPSFLVSGTYFLRLLTAGGEFRTVKIIVEN